MRYAVIQCVDGNFKVMSEWNDPEKARKAYHTLCASLWNDKSFEVAHIAILDNQLDVFNGYKERIEHEAQPVQVPEEAVEAEA